LRKKNETRPFEDETSIEFLSNKNDCSLFAFGSHSKKRPHNLVLGRLFDEHILDMIELGLESYTPMEEFKAVKPAYGSKPAFVFQGPEWEANPDCKRLGSLLVDFFRGAVVTNLSLPGLDRVIVLTVVTRAEAPVLIHFRHYATRLRRSGTTLPRVELEEVGPHFDFVIRRTKFAADDLLKESLKQPREVSVPRPKKNISRSVLGDRLGRVHVPRQELSGMAVRRFKGTAVTKRKQKHTAKRTREQLDSSAAPAAKRSKSVAEEAD